MKAFLFILLIALAGCKSASDPCAAVVCQNGGSCANGSCNCPNGFYGKNCESAQPTKWKASVTYGYDDYHNYTSKASWNYVTLTYHGDGTITITDDIGSPSANDSLREGLRSPLTYHPVSGNRYELVDSCWQGKYNPYSYYAYFTVTRDNSGKLIQFYWSLERTWGDVFHAYGTYGINQ